MNNVLNFTDLPADILNMIFTINREDALKESNMIKEFWEEWEDMYDDDLYELYGDGIISSPDWNELTKEEQSKIYNSHNRSMRIHEDILCCGYSDELYPSN